MTSSQQQSTICMIVEQCCEDEQAHNELSNQILTHVQQNQNKEVRQIVDTIKKIIKNKKTDSPNKVLALKLLHILIMQGNNEEFFLYCEKKIIRRLQILARFKKESIDLEKGALLFGKQFNQKASADFLKLLLLYIQKWGTYYQNYPNSQRQTEFNKLYQGLQKEHIHFPSEDNILQSLCTDYYNEQNKQGSPSSTVHSSINQSQVINRNQFLSHQVQSSNNNHQQLERPETNTQVQQFKTNKAQASSLSQQEQAKLIKSNYKKLNDYQETKKLYDELLQEGQLDEDLLLQMRTQLQEGKEFTENFLQQLMDTTISIKDKEQKIDKILGILNELSEQLEKVLALRPYSPRSLQKMKESKEDVKEENKFDRTDPQNLSKIDIYETQSTPNPGGLRKKTRNKNKNLGNESHRGIQHSQQLDNVEYGKDIFKTNFMSSTPQVDLQKSSLAQPFWLNNKQFDQIDNVQDSAQISVNNFQSKEEEQNQSNQKQNQEKKEEKKENDQVGVNIASPREQITNQEQISQSQNDRQCNHNQMVKSQEIKPQESKSQEIIPQENGKIKQQEFQIADKKKFGVIQKQGVQPKLMHLSPDSNISSEHDSSSFKECSNGKQDTFSFQPVQQNQENDNDFFKFDLHPVNQETNDAFNFDFNQNQQNEQKQQHPPLFTQSQTQYKKSPTKPESRQERPMINNQEHEMQDRIEELEEQSYEIKQQNESLISKIQNFNDKIQEKEKVIQQEQQEKSQLKVEIEHLNKDIKSLKNYEFMYEETLQAKTQIENEVSNLKTQLNEYKLSLERYENKVIKKEGEIDKLTTQLKMNEDLEDQLSSKDREIEKLKRELEEKEKIEDGLRSSLRQTEERLESPYQQQNYKIIKNQKQSPDSILKIKRNQIQQVISISPSQENKSQSESPFKFSTAQPSQSRQEGGFSLDTFLTSNQPKAFEQETLELVDPIVLQNENKQKQTKQEVKEDEFSYEEMFARVPSGDSDYDESQSQLQQNQLTQQNLQHQSEVSQAKTPQFEQQQEQQKQIFEYNKSKSNLDNEDEFHSAKSEPDQEEEIKQDKKDDNELWDFFGNQNNQVQQESNGFDDFWDFTNTNTQQPIQNKEISESSKENKNETDIKQTQNQQALSQSIEKTTSEQNKNGNDNIVQATANQNNKKQDDLLWIFDTDIKQNKQDNIVEQKQPSPIQKETAQNKKVKDFEDLFDFNNQTNTNMNKSNENIAEQQQLVSQQENNNLKNIKEENKSVGQEQNQNKQFQNSEEVLEERKLEQPVQKQRSLTIQNQNSQEQQHHHSEEKQQIQQEFKLFDDLLNNQNKNVQQSSNIQKQVQNVPQRISQGSQVNQSLDQNMKINQDRPRANSNLAGSKQDTSQDSQQQHKLQNVQPNQLHNVERLNSIQNENKGTPQQTMRPNIEQSDEKTLTQGSSQKSNNQYISPRQNIIDNLFEESRQQQPLRIEQNQNNQQFVEQKDATLKERSNSINYSVSGVHAQHKSEPLSQVQQTQQQQQKSLTASQELQSNQHQQQEVHRLSNPTQNQQKQLPQSQIIHQEQQAQPITSPTQQNQQQKDQKFNTQQFTTANTQSYLQQQQQRQQQQHKIDPQLMFRHILHSYFRKSLISSNKSLLYEDQHIQIGMFIEYQSNIVKMKLFFGNKNSQQNLQQVYFKPQRQGQGYSATQTRDYIQEIQHQRQEPIDLQLVVNSYQISTPTYLLSYKMNNVPVNNIPLRLPIVAMKLCNGVQNLDQNSFIQGWNTECGPKSESRHQFTMDLNQCKSLSQLKENLMFGRKALHFIDGVEQQKNIVCGATMFSLQQIFALVKIQITQSGQGCEIIARSNDKNENAGIFGKQVISSILELIALK